MRQFRPTASAVLSLIRWDRPYGTMLLLAPALWSLVIAAKGHPPAGLVLIFILGSFLMRSAGCAMNDLADRSLDARVDRTRERPLPSGRLKPVEALAVFAALALLAFSLIWFLNPLTRWMSVFGIVIAVSYPFSKRFLRIPQIFMGVAFGWSAVMAWTAVRDSIEWPTVWIFLATVCWATAYDTIYAGMDREADARMGVGSSAVLFGNNLWLAVGIFYGLAVMFLLVTGLSTGMGPAFYLVLSVVAAIFARQAVLLRFGPDVQTLFRLFKAHTGIGFLLLTGMIAGFIG